MSLLRHILIQILFYQINKNLLYFELNTNIINNLMKFTQFLHHNQNLLQKITFLTTKKLTCFIYKFKLLQTFHGIIIKSFYYEELQWTQFINFIWHEHFLKFSQLSLLTVSFTKLRYYKHFTGLLLSHFTMKNYNGHNL